MTTTLTFNNGVDSCVVGRHGGGRLHDHYNRVRRHSSWEMHSPIEFEAILATRAADNVTGEEAA
jgi:hypothetical protein